IYISSFVAIPFFVPGRPVIFPHNKTITAVYGQPLTLTMEFCANPTYNKVYWIAKDRVYKPGESDSEILTYYITNSTSPNCYQAVMYLSEVKVRNIGEYVLIVRSANGLSEGIVNVNMTYASGYNINTNSASHNNNNNQLPIFILYMNVIILILMSCY
ncbi:PREDICTED: uncharacterized protein LOC108565323, partial [Nicrophorus vespilloides]|uniref:Uncharacterized protein LOC108565323 n=1 Tax=Nicrophorus vespilloides TaxID=110193 RepID=A0ABM1N070_NICVS